MEKTIMDEWLTTREAAELTGYHPLHIRRLIHAGRVKAIKKGRDWLVSKTGLLNYMDQVRDLGDKRGPKTD
jgi:excisionase family DNA binding protein